MPQYHWSNIFINKNMFFWSNFFGIEYHEIVRDMAIRCLVRLWLLPSETDIMMEEIEDSVGLEYMAARTKVRFEVIFLF